MLFQINAKFSNKKNDDENICIEGSGERRKKRYKNEMLNTTTVSGCLLIFIFYVFELIDGI